MTAKLLKKLFGFFVFAFLVAPVNLAAEPFYLSYTYPGSIGFFKLKERPKEAKVVVKAGGKEYTFPVLSEKAYFVIPYGSKGKVFVTLYENGKKKDRRVIKVARKKYRVSRIWVREPKYTPELLRRIKKEQELLRDIFSQVTPKKFKETFLKKPLKKLRVSTPFGAKRIINGKKRSVHWGTDFRAPLGTPVYASLSGKVVLARELYFTGKTVIIDHGLGIHTLYAHLSKITVKEGQFVKAGQLLGKVGSTGRSTGPHLHFGFYVSGVRADPMLVLKSRL